MHQGSTVTWQNVVIDLFALGIVNFGKLCSVANTLQERCFASVRPADYEDSEVTYVIEVLSDFRRIQLDLSGRAVCDHVHQEILKILIFTICDYSVLILLFVTILYYLQLFQLFLLINYLS